MNGKYLQITKPLTSLPWCKHEDGDCHNKTLIELHLLPVHICELDEELHNTQVTLNIEKQRCAELEVRHCSPHILSYSCIKRTLSPMYSITSCHYQLFMCNQCQSLHYEIPMIDSVRMPYFLFASCVQQAMQDSCILQYIILNYSDLQ